MQLQPVILSGGAGTRLWPLSREAYPKQFLPLVGSSTMLQDTIARLDGLVLEPPHLSTQDSGILPSIVVCNEEHRFLVAEQFRLLGAAAPTILLEPIGRNTAPALTLAALQALETGQDLVMLVMPADHNIENPAEFRRVVALGHAQAREGAVITFGIVPTTAETGYGYIHRGAPEDAAGEIFALDKFREKPDKATAESYIASGEYYWNSGIFMLRAGVWLELIEHFAPEIFKICHAVFADRNKDGDFVRVNSQIFATCPSNSIDYAVMEHLTATQAALLPLAAGWSDLGSWSSLWELRPHDPAGNVIEGDVYVHDSQNNLLIAQHRMVAVVGLDDLIVVETPDAVLVLDKTRAQDVRVVTEYLKAQHRSELRQHRRCHRPWGSYEPIDMGSRYQVKRLTVAPGQSLSLQLHYHRAEHWIVVSGTAKVTCGEEVFLLTENQSTYIPLGVRHRLENPGTISLEIIEVQSGSYLGEDDIVRFDDLYHRLT